jgi:hypothetical protein
MEHTHVEISDLVNRIDTGEIRLPEIQRAYVWKPTQVAHLIDSLYRGYPSGSMLLWRPSGKVRERMASITAGGVNPLGTVQYLLDGQQRLTSLHRVFHRHPRATVVFNVATEKFQVQSALTAKDAHWVTAADVLLTDTPSTIRKTIIAADPALNEDLVDKRLARLSSIARYRYYLEILTDLAYEEVAQIFVRVNSRGRALKTVDLTLATLSARWPGVVQKIEDESDNCRQRGWPRMDATFLVRTLAGTATSAATLGQLPETPTEDLEAAWKRVKLGVEWLTRLLAENAQIKTSTLIPSMNALVPLAVLLGRLAEAKDEPLEEADALIYWLYAVFITGRFSAAADTKIATDSLAARSGDPVHNLYKNAGLTSSPVAVTATNLIGKGAGSPYFLLSYLAAKGRHAKDWWHDIEISETSGAGGFSIEYHHVHPQVTLRPSYSKGEINDLANLAFISATANKKISGRSPKAYFRELLDPAVAKDELSPHLVPLAEDLRTEDRYSAFLVERRALLVAAMNELLLERMPAWVGEAAAHVEVSETSLSLTLYEGSDPRLAFDARVEGERYFASIAMIEFERFLRDVEDGIAATLDIGGQTASTEPGDEDVVIPVGALEVTGAHRDWQAVIERERSEALVSDEPMEPDSAAFDGERVEFAIAESD